MTLTRKTYLRRESEKHKAKRLAGPPAKRKPLAKVGKQKSKRQARNAAYYKSPEWRAKRKAVFERDGYQCVEEFAGIQRDAWMPFGMGYPVLVRCPNRGEIVNAKQTARGLVCEETSYGHRGNPTRIDTCKTRCRDCDRRLTPFERINHSRGFNNGAERGT